MINMYQELCAVPSPPKGISRSKSESENFHVKGLIISCIMIHVGKKLQPHPPPQPHRHDLKDVEFKVFNEVLIFKARSIMIQFTLNMVIVF